MARLAEACFEISVQVGSTGMPILLALHLLQSVASKHRRIMVFSPEAKPIMLRIPVRKEPGPTELCKHCFVVVI